MRILYLAIVCFVCSCSDKQQAQKPPTITDPVQQYLPYSTLTYIIKAQVNTENKLTINIQLLVPPNTPEADESGIVAKAKSAALDYLTFRKIDPNKYTVNYEIVHEELNGH